jgi:hypothetical protein
VGYWAVRFRRGARDLNFDVFDKANWERLAELAGETVDMQAWQAWARERGKALADVR